MWQIASSWTPTFGPPFMKGGAVPDVPGSSGQVKNIEVEVGPPGLRDDFIRSTVASTDYCSADSLRLVWVPLGCSQIQEDQDDQQLEYCHLQLLRNIRGSQRLCALGGG